MCGRYSETKLEAVLRKRFRISNQLGNVLPRYNLAPGQDGLVVLGGRERTLASFRWGLVPRWASDPAVGNRMARAKREPRSLAGPEGPRSNRMINARSESLVTKASFAEAFRKRRCLVPADGFYEWKRTPAGRLPVRFVVKGQEPFGFAGLWDSWRRPDGSELKTYTIVTTVPNDLVRPVHDRMPVLLKPEDEELWLDPSVDDPDRLSPLLAPYPAELMEASDVSPLLNSVANDGPECLEPSRAPVQLTLL